MYRRLTQDANPAVGETAPHAPLWPTTVRGLLRHANPVMPIILLSIIAVAAIVGPQLAPGKSTRTDLSLSLMPPAWLEGGNWHYPLGTDSSGRDILSRIMDGARVSVTVAGGALLLTGAIGITLGVLAG